jgi:cyclophilin family peptidyl-prolyl cis-trans isomerase
VVEGMDVVDKIAAVHKGANDRPLTPVIIEKAVAVDEKASEPKKIL